MLYTVFAVNQYHTHDTTHKNGAGTPRQIADERDFDFGRDLLGKTMRCFM